MIVDGPLCGCYCCPKLITNIKNVRFRSFFVAAIVMRIKNVRFRPFCVAAIILYLTKLLGLVPNLPNLVMYSSDWRCV